MQTIILYDFIYWLFTHRHVFFHFGLILNCLADCVTVFIYNYNKSNYISANIQVYNFLSNDIKWNVSKYKHLPTRSHSNVIY